MSLEQTVAQVRTINPQVRSSRYRWESAKHQIIQNYTPADPQFTFADSDSWRGFLAGSGLHNMTLTQSLQFPGKGLLQGQVAERTSEIARLTYMAALRDVTAQTKTAYYQNQLDLALNDLITENVTNLQRVLKVTQIAYTASLATQGDYINAKFAVYSRCARVIAVSRFFSALARVRVGQQLEARRSGGCKWSRPGT